MLFVVEVDRVTCYLYPMRSSPFVINLRKTERGFLFQTLEDSTPLVPTTKKQAKAITGAPKQVQSKNTNRLMKEIESINKMAAPVEEPPVKR